MSCVLYDSDETVVCKTNTLWNMDASHILTFRRFHGESYFLQFGNILHLNVLKRFGTVFAQNERRSVPASSFAYHLTCTYSAALLCIIIFRRSRYSFSKKFPKYIIWSSSSLYAFYALKFLIPFHFISPCVHF